MADLGLEVTIALDRTRDLGAIRGALMTAFRHAEQAVAALRAPDADPRTTPSAPPEEALALLPVYMDEIAALIRLALAKPRKEPQ